MDPIGLQPPRLCRAGYERGALPQGGSGAPRGAGHVPERVALWAKDTFESAAVGTRLPPATPALTHLRPQCGLLTESQEQDAADVGTYVWESRWFRKPKLLVSQLPRRVKDTKTVVVFELDNFGDIGSTPLFNPPFPIPVYGVLGLGGIACLWFGAVPAIQDVVEGRRNLRVLRGEEKFIDERRAQVIDDLFAATPEVHTARARQRELLRLAIHHAQCKRERESELLDRIVSGLLIAPGAILTGLGTFVTPGFVFGAHSALAGTIANLLTGFVGNGPIAAYAVINAGYNSHKTIQAHRRLRLMRRYNLNRIWGDEIDVDGQLRHRLRLIRNTAACKSVSSFGIGVGGVLTALTPFGYAVLLPFAIMRAGAEYLTHRKLGYSRKLYHGEPEDLSRRALVNDFIYRTKVFKILKDAKVESRQRYPYGTDTPMPINYIMKAVGWIRSRRLPPAPPPAQHIRSILMEYNGTLEQWLRRRQVTVERQRMRGFADYTGERADWVDMWGPEINALQERMQQAASESAAIAREAPDAMYAEGALGWVERVVRFFVENALFAEFGEAMYNDTVLRPTLHAAITNGTNAKGKRTMRIAAVPFLNDLRRNGRWRDAKFLDAFYLCAEQLLLGGVKQYFQELRRETMDMITYRIWLQHHPTRKLKEAYRMVGVTERDSWEEGPDELAAEIHDDRFAVR